MSSERQENSPDNPWWGEHVHRYETVSAYVPVGAKVLDIACGSGFGSYHLATEGYQVTGADLSEETLTVCWNEFTHPHLSFVCANAAELPFPSEHFDAIVSFETIEHTTRYKEVLLEFKRVLKKSGVILISTPNICVNSPDGIVRNPYHTQEWNYTELQHLLQEAFPSVKIFGQEYQRYHASSGINYSLAKNLEKWMYLRGVRKLPLRFQNTVINSLIKKPMYPIAGDYGWVEDLKRIEACKTFFAVCRLQ